MVVVDDGSTDETVACARTFGDRIRLLKRPHGGLGPARAVGIAASTGDYIASLDSDDLWDPQTLAVQLDVATRHPTSGLIVTDGTTFGNPHEPDRSLFTGEADDLFISPEQHEITGWFHREFTMGNRVACPAQTLVPRAVCDAVGPHLHDPERHPGLRLLPPGSHVRTRSRSTAPRLARWRFRPDSQSGDVDERALRWTTTSVAVLARELAVAGPEYPGVRARRVPRPRASRGRRAPRHAPARWTAGARLPRHPLPQRGWNPSSSRPAPSWRSHRPPDGRSRVRSAARNTPSNRYAAAGTEARRVAVEWCPPRRGGRLPGMFTVGRNFHVIHMTDDLAALDAWYVDVFGMQRYVIENYSPELHRHASLGVIGELCIEPMQPAFDDERWNRGPIGRYYERSGISWHSIAWYVDDVEGLTELRDGLEAADVELLALLGGKLEHDADAPEDRPIFTHPNSTVTQLEFMVPHPNIPDVRPHPAFSPAWWHTTHPLHIRKTSHFTLATRASRAGPRPLRRRDQRHAAARGRERAAADAQRVHRHRSRRRGGDRRTARRRHADRRLRRREPPRVVRGVAPGRRPRRRDRLPRGEEDRGLPRRWHELPVRSGHHPRRALGRHHRRIPGDTRPDW